MCGLTGYFNIAASESAEVMSAIAGRMSDALRHRGPDDAGTWCDPAIGVALGFRRLSILDLSPLGHQPMMSSCGRFVIVYNGEVFNHNELRAELASRGRRFRGRSDTEVLVEGFAEWGIEATIQRCLGMFAIAVWDTQKNELTLIRDRLGKKPLYYGRFGSTLLFGSELKSLKVHPSFQAKIDREALGEFLRQSYLSDQSIYQNITPLRPGTSVTIRRDDDEYWNGSRSISPKSFWSFRKVIADTSTKPFTGTYEEAIERLDVLLTDAVGRRMEADVPLGAFLSGGIDSSLVVALMQKQSTRPIKTFTIGFEEERFNEAPFAKRIAAHLKTDHTELCVTSQVAMDVIPKLPNLFDEPFGDSSQIPTYLVCQLARRHVTVALSGDGGDELFCGYRRYFEALEGFFPSKVEGGIRNTMSRLRFLPASVRRALAQSTGLAGRLPLGRLARMFSRASEVFNETSPHCRYLRNLSHWRDLENIVVGLSQPGDSSRRGPWEERGKRSEASGLSPSSDSPRLTPREPTGVTFGFPGRVSSPCWESAMRELIACSDQVPASPEEFQQAWQVYDTLNYLPGDILTKVDRASMGISLEARTPLLDHRVVEFAWSLPHSFKVQGRTGKRILQDLLARYVPRELFVRPKVGFGIPIGEWLRGPLRDWAEHLLDEHRLKREGFFHPQPVRQKWEEHLRGRADWGFLLWDILMFQAWFANR